MGANMGTFRGAIDLRQNPGGDYFEGLHHLIEPIAKNPSLNCKGHLFVLIGPLTSSAAMVNAVQFHTQTNAILVGEPIGPKPTSYAERRQMELPNSHLVVSYSAKYYEFAYSSKNVARPDQEIRPRGQFTRRDTMPLSTGYLNTGADNH
jgi:hypothetical protein